MAELVDAADSKSAVRKDVQVRFLFRALLKVCKSLIYRLLIFYGYQILPFFPVFVHPINGSIIHISDKVQNQLHRRLLSLHYTLFAGTAGKITVFFIGILFLV